MKYVPPNITFGASVLREKKFQQIFYNVFDSLCQPINEVESMFHFSANGRVTILRYREIDNFIVFRLLQIEFRKENIETTRTFSEEFAASNHLMRDFLFHSSKSETPVRTSNVIFNYYDSSIVTTHRLLFPIVVRDFSRNMKSPYGMSLCKDVLLKRFPFNVGGRNSFCDGLLFPKDNQERPIKITDFIDINDMKKLVSLTNGWLKQIKTKELKAINKEVIIAV